MSPTTTGLSAPILIVEDDTEARLLLERILQLAGLPTVTASGNRQVLGQLAHRLPALVLLDLRLRDGDPVAVVRAVRRAAGRSVPIVVVSTAPYNPRRARELGACAWIEKPFRVEQLLGVIESALAEQEARGQEPETGRTERP